MGSSSSSVNLSVGERSYTREIVIDSGTTFVDNCMQDGSWLGLFNDTISDVPTLCARGPDRRMNMGTFQNGRDDLGQEHDLTVKVDW